jgi:hypothetical protein
MYIYSIVSQDRCIYIMYMYSIVCDTMLYMYIIHTQHTHTPKKIYFADPLVPGRLPIFPFFAFFPPFVRESLWAS